MTDSAQAMECSQTIRKLVVSVLALLAGVFQSGSSEALSHNASTHASQDPALLPSVTVVCYHLHVQCDQARVYLTGSHTFAG